MSTNTANKPKRQSPSRLRLLELEQRIMNLKDDLACSQRERVELQLRIESISKALGQERLFWYYMVYNFRFHHANAAVAKTPDEVRDSTLALQTATLDLLMSPSEPSSTFTASWHQNHRTHRVMAGPQRDADAISGKTARLINASQIS